MNIMHDLEDMIEHQHTLSTRTRLLEHLLFQPPLKCPQSCCCDIGENEQISFGTQKG